jgi:hypothetical protein
VGFEPSDRIPLRNYLSDIHLMGENLSLSSSIIATLGERNRNPSHHHPSLS